MPTTAVLIQDCESLAKSTPLFRLSLAQNMDDLISCHRLRYQVFNCELGEGLLDSLRLLSALGRRFFHPTLRGNSAELSHQSQSVPPSVRIKNLSVSDVVNRDPLHGYFSARGGNFHVFTLMRARNGPASNDLSPFGDRVFNRERQVRKAGRHFHDPPFVQLRAYLRTRHDGVVECMARGNQLIHNFQLALIPNFFIEAANDGPVIHGHWDSPPPDSLIHLWRSALPCGTALRTPGMARLEQAYSGGVWVAMLMDGNAVSELCSFCDSLRIVAGAASRPALFPQLFPITEPLPHLVRQRESDLMREHTHLPAMVGFVRNHVAQHFHANRPRPSPAVSAKLLDSAPTTAQRFSEHLRAASGALGQSRAGLLPRAVRAVELSWNLQVRSC